MKKQIVFLCVGTSTISGDSLAPTIGDMLIEQNIPCYVYGTSKQNVNQQNLDSYLAFIRYNHPNCLLITVDSALSKSLPIGSVKISNDGISPGKAVNLATNRIGNIGIVGVVNYYDINTIKALSCVNEGFILAFSKHISSLIVKSLIKANYIN